MTDAALTAAEGVGEVVLDAGVIGIPRSLYLYVNNGVQSLAVHSATTGRSLYLYVNNAIEALSIAARSLYLYENVAIEALLAAARSLYLYEATRDLEVFPWLMRLSPVEQFVGGQVDLYGDGLGEIVDVAAAATATASSTNGSNVPGSAIDRTDTTKWQSTDGSGAWLRLTFATPQTLSALALVDQAAGGAWGTPLFRFSDAGPDVIGGQAPAAAPAVAMPDYATGTSRTYYALPAPRTVTWVEVRVSSGGVGSTRGLAEVWAYADKDESAETSTVDISALWGVSSMGIVSWQNRSPGLWPANSGLPIAPAATVTVGPDAQSGQVRVTEST